MSEKKNPFSILSTSSRFVASQAAAAPVKIATTRTRVLPTIKQKSSDDDDDESDESVDDTTDEGDDDDDQVLASSDDDDDDDEQDDRGEPALKRGRRVLKNVDEQQNLLQVDQLRTEIKELGKFDEVETKDDFDDDEYQTKMNSLSTALSQRKRGTNLSTLHTRLLNRAAILIDQCEAHGVDAGFIMSTNTTRPRSRVVATRRYRDVYRTRLFERAIRSGFDNLSQSKMIFHDPQHISSNEKNYRLAAAQKRRSSTKKKSSIFVAAAAASSSK